MKKLLILMMTLVMAAAMTACTPAEQEAYDLYLAMNKANEGVTSMEVTMNSTMKMTAQGETIDMVLSGTVKEVLLSDTEVEMEMIMDMTYAGQSVTATSYFKDGYLYQEVAGQKYKSEMDMEQAMSMANSVESMQFEKEAVISSSVTEVEGGKELSFVLAGDKVTEMMNSMMGSTFESMGVSESAMTLGDMSYSTVLDKDNLAKSADISMPMTLEIEGESVTVDYQVSQTITGYNTITSIDFPTDLDSYIAAA